jgi:hypothetical protein
LVQRIKFLLMILEMGFEAKMGFQKNTIILIRKEEVRF